MMKKQIKVTLTRSTNGIRKSHLATIRGLGLRRLRSTQILFDTPEIRGMLRKINYLITISKSGNKNVND